MEIKKLAAATGIVLSLAGATPVVAFAKHGADDPAGHVRGGHGADDGARHTHHGGDDGPRHG
jgi:Spy/CpxP family protein refolding chaperone